MRYLSQFSTYSPPSSAPSVIFHAPLHDIFPICPSSFPTLLYTQTSSFSILFLPNFDHFSLLKSNFLVAFSRCSHTPRHHFSRPFTWNSHQPPIFLFRFYPHPMFMFSLIFSPHFHLFLLWISTHFTSFPLVFTPFRIIFHAQPTRHVHLYPSDTPIAT